MSAAPIILPNTEIYDFTTNLANAYHNSQLKELNIAGNNVYVLPAGDFNANGVNTVIDYNRYLQLLGIEGYSDGDLNFDGNTTNEDFDLYNNNASRFNIPYLRDE